MCPDEKTRRIVIKIMMVAYLMVPLLVGCDDGTSVVYDLDGHGVASVPSSEVAVTVFYFHANGLPDLQSLRPHGGEDPSRVRRTWG